MRFISIYIILLLFVKCNNFDSLTLVNKPMAIYFDKKNIEKIEFLDNKNPNAIYDLMSYLQE